MRWMPFIITTLGALLIFSCIGCSDGKNKVDSDSISIADEDASVEYDNAVDEEVEDNDFNDETKDVDEDSPDEDSDSVAQYASCYDEIPDEPYEGLFADPNLEKQIKSKLGIGENEQLKESDLEQITDLYVRQIKDFRGLEKLINLEKFGFSVGGNIYDFTPLSGLKKIKKFTIFYNDLNDFDNMNCLDGSFSKLTSIEELEINGTELKDVSPIEQLTNLKILDISENQIEFLPENMENLQKLEELYLYGNKIDDILPLETLTNLSNLALNYNNVKDILPIKNMSKLARFNASNNNIADISVIENLPNLISFAAHINKITILPDNFSDLKKLNYLDLSYNEILELPAMAGLDSLKTLYLGHNEISDMTPLDSLENLEVLSIAGNKITKIPILKNLKSLWDLGLEMNEITDLSGLSDNDSFPGLNRLGLSYNKIENAEPLRKREGLGSLYIDNNCIKDLLPLEELKESGCSISGMDEQLERCEDTMLTLAGEMKWK
ncbi:MAG TPA: leucine-rich repeat domain-containing protein [bacterium]|nr:leucine-rich repeat domain-containing protein [bacterium]